MTDYLTSGAKLTASVIAVLVSDELAVAARKASVASAAVHLASIEQRRLQH